MNATSPWQLLARYLRPHRIQVLLLWLALLATIATQLVNPQIIRRFIDSAEAGSDLVILLGAAGLFLLIALVEQALGLAATYISTDVGWRATNELREDVVRHCLGLDRNFHKAHGPGELIERIDGDINDLRNFFSQLALNLLNNLLLMSGVLVLLWWEDWRIGLAVTLISGTGLVLVDWLRRAAVPYWQQARQRTAELYGYLEERLHGTEDIRANGAVAYAMHGLYAHIQRAYKAALGTRLYDVGGLMTPIWVFGLAYVVIFLLGDRLHYQGSMSIGTVYLLIHYLELLSGPLWETVNEVRDLQTAGASIGRVQELLQTKNSIQDRGQQSLHDGPLAVDFAQVSMRYEAESDLILQDIDFRLQAREVLGLLGRTGSGKTTLTRLLLRLVEPSEGTIRLGNDGALLTELSLSELRSRVGMVTQDVQLFQATIRDNLTFFDQVMPDERLWAMAREFGLEEWLASLPDGLETMLGTGGDGLSAGEAQLIAFMRIGLQDPGLIILDEPSSRLDPVTERLLDQAIGRLLVGRTGIIIAHRLETVQRVDKVMILAEGRIAEFGERSALMDQDDSEFTGLLSQL
ncbi:MAG: ABC transporter ATP-binding protein [Chloroflexota bacterium]